MKKVGYLITGLALGLTISAASPVVASTVKTISAKINSSVSVALNGEKVKLNTQPIEYNNLNYLPVGEIGRALGLGVEYDKTKNTININSPSTSNIPTQTSRSDSVNNSAPSSNAVETVKIGDSITKDGITTSIDKIEYISDEENVDGIVLKNGYKMYITVTNNSDYALQPGMSYKFSTSNNLDEQILNSLGATFLLKSNDKYLNRPIVKGETAKGFIFINYDKNVNIEEISYYPNLIGAPSSQPNAPFGIWTNK